MNELPNFENDFLNNVALSFSKVRKPLKYDAFEVKFNKIIDAIDGEKVEKIEIVVRSSRSKTGIRTRLDIWGDRWIYLDIRKPKKKGWEWEYTIQGRLSGSANEIELMKAFKAFQKNSLLFNSKTIHSAANEHWNTLIAMGPKEVPSK